LVDSSWLNGSKGSKHLKIGQARGTSTFFTTLCHPRGSAKTWDIFQKNVFVLS
jgi:hypothetical protein